MRPQVFVEIGSPTGVSYAACSAVVKRVEPNARCVAVDPCTDSDEPEHCIGGPLNGDQVVPTERLTLSRVWSCHFQDSVTAIEDACVDLLHIDAVHVKGSEKLDLEIFRPKLSEKAIVLLYGTRDTML